MTNAELLARWAKQTDSISPTRWTPEEFISFANDTIDELTEELSLIEDTGTQTLNKSISFTASTKTITRIAGNFILDGYKPNMPIFTTSSTNPGPFTLLTITTLNMTVVETVIDAVAAIISIYDAICHIPILTDGTVIYPIDDRINRISRVKLSKEDTPMGILREDGIAIMDANYTGWESETTEGTPNILITEGIGTNKVRIYPPSDTADILYLTVFRNQMNPLDVSLPDESPEIPEKFHKYLDNGVFKRCYNKDEQEVLKPGLAKQYGLLFEQDKENIERKLIKRNFANMTATPPAGCL